MHPDKFMDNKVFKLFSLRGEAVICDMLAVP